MTNDQLRFFLAVVQYGNESQAAEHLRIDQSRINRVLRALESELQHPLYERQRGRSQLITLTQFGERLLLHAQTVLNSETSLTADFDRIANGYRHILRLAVVPGVSQTLYYHYLTPLLQQHQDWCVECVEGNVPAIEQAVATSKAELGLSNSDILHAENFKLLFAQTTRYHIVCRRDNPWLELNRSYKISDLQGIPLCLTVNSGPRVCSIFSKAGLVPNVRVYNSARQTSIYNVKLGLGITLYPSLLPPDDDELAWLPLEEPELVSREILFQKSGHRLSPIAKAFAKYYLEKAGVTPAL